MQYEYFDIDGDGDARQFVLEMNNGRQRFPLVVVEQRIVLQPTVATLQRVLKEHGIRPAIRTIGDAGVRR